MQKFGNVARKVPSRRTHWKLRPPRNKHNELQQLYTQYVNVRDVMQTINKVALAYECVLTSVTVDAIKKSETRNNKHFCLQICPTFSILLFRTEFKFSSLRKLKMDFNITVACIIVRRLLISVHKQQSSGIAATHEYWSQHDAHLVYLPNFHGLNFIIFS